MIWIWISIEIVSRIRIRIGVKTMPIHTNCMEAHLEAHIGVVMASIGAV